MLRTAFAFFLKDIEDALRSHSLVFILLGPIIMGALFTRIMGDPDSSAITLGIYGRTGSGLVNCLKFSGGCTLKYSSDWQALKEEVKNGKLSLAVSIPRDFDEELRDDGYPVLKVYVDESHFARSVAARELLRTALRQMAGQELPADIRVEKVNAFEGSMNLAFLPMWAVFTCMGAMSVASATLVEELEQKTMEAVLLAPVSWPEILGGKAACSFVLSWTASWAVLACSSGYHIPNIQVCLLLALGSLAFSLLGIALGLSIKGQTACGALNSILFLIFIMPVTMADYSNAMRIVSRFLPSWYLCSGLNRAMFTPSSSPWMDIRFETAGLTAFAAVFALLSALALHRLRRTV